jgi:hypothetical protein
MVEAVNWPLIRAPFTVKESPTHNSSRADVPPKCRENVVVLVTYTATQPLGHGVAVIIWGASALLLSTAPDKQSSEGAVRELGAEARVPTTFWLIGVVLVLSVSFETESNWFVKRSKTPRAVTWSCSFYRPMAGEGGG